MFYLSTSSLTFVSQYVARFVESFIDAPRLIDVAFIGLKSLITGDCKSNYGGSKVLGKKLVKGE